MRPTIDDVRSLGDISMAFRWYMEIIPPKALVGYSNGMQFLNLRCESTDLPKMTNQKVTTEIRGHKVYDNGIWTYTDNITLNFVETVDNSVKSFIRQWRELCWQMKTGKSRSKKDIEAVINLNQLDNMDNIIWIYTLYGVILDSYELPQLTNQSEAHKPTITIDYDYFDDSETVPTALAPSRA
jgi:hypothetical protein